MKVGRGVFVGIPTPLLQCLTHYQTGVPLDAPTIFNNFAVSHAIYGADRISSTVAPLAKERLTTRAAALASAGFYASSPHTLPLAPIVLGLHTSYSQVKPTIAPVKPFFVGAMWSLAIYGVPLLRQGTPMDILTPAALMLSIASLSHAADVPDVEEDLEAGVFTPATQMSRAEATWYAAALSLSAAALHPPPTAYDALVASASIGIAANRSWTGAAVACAVVARDLDVHGKEYMRSLVETVIASSEGAHSVSLRALMDIVHSSSGIPEPWKGMLLEFVFSVLHAGDEAGGLLLGLYEYLITN